jgi:hypothetical protein
MDASTFRSLRRAVEEGADLRDRLDQSFQPSKASAPLELFRAIVVDIRDWSDRVGAHMPAIDVENGAHDDIKGRLLGFLDRQIALVDQRRYGA